LIENINPQPTQDNPLTVESYPYGFRLRTKARYYIETTKRGQRVVFQTLNPKTHTWNNPKKSTYSDIRILYRNTENGHIENSGLSFAYTREGDLEKFLKNFPESTLSKYQREQLRFLRAVFKTRKHLTVNVVSNATKEESARINANNKKTSKTLHGILGYYLKEGEKAK